MCQNPRDFDDWYKSHPHYYSVPSDGLIKCLKDYAIGPCKTLDVGCGQGRNALWLASKGFQVAAIDNSHFAIQALKKAANAQRLRIDARLTDIRSFDFGVGLFDLIVIQTTLNHLDLDYIPVCCEKIVESLALQGVIYCVVFTTEDPGFKAHSEIASECANMVKHYFSSGELRRLFSKLEILEYKEYTKADNTHGPMHFHGKAKLIGRKT